MYLHALAEIRPSGMDVSTVCPMQKFCPQGHENSDSALFCSQCGAHVGPPSVLPAPPPMPGTAASPGWMPPPSGALGGDRSRSPLIVTLCGNLALVVGSFMPWAEITTVFGQISVDGMRGDGVITAGAGVLAALGSGLALAQQNSASGGDSLSRVAVVGGVVLSIIGALIAGNILLNVADVASETTSSVAVATVGPGLYVCLLGGLVGSVGGVVSARSMTPTVSR